MGLLQHLATFVPKQTTMEQTLKKKITVLKL